MRLLKCPKCGEMFSDTYKTCPFCQEDEEIHNGKPVKTGGRRVGGGKAKPKVGGGVVAVCLVLVLGLLAYTIFGSQLTELFTGGKDEPPAQSLALSQKSANLTVGGSMKLTASGSDSSIIFSSSDEAVATVSADGTVQAVGEGSAVVTAKAGSLTASCNVAVKAAATDSEPVKPDAPAGSDLVLQSIYGTSGEFSCNVGEAVPLEVEGTESTVTWSSSNSQIVTVDASGIATAVASGKATISAVVNGQTLTIEVLVW